MPGSLYSYYFGFILIDGEEYSRAEFDALYYAYCVRREQYPDTPRQKGLELLREHIHEVERGLSRDPS